MTRNPEKVAFATSRGDDGVQFTGERYLPNVRGEIRLEHIHRYFFAANFTANLDVLDIACGEGYGSSTLAAGARKVVGVDIDSATVARASTRYGSPSCSFRVGDIEAIPYEDHAFDVVVCFETLEHVANHQRVMTEIRRVLRRGGLLICSTPNAIADDGSLHEKNPYHIKEFTEEELLSSNHFVNTDLLEQRFLHGSLIMPSLGREQTRILLSSKDRESFSARNGDFGKFYLIALASDKPLPFLPVHGLDGRCELDSERDEFRFCVGEMHRQADVIRQLEQEVKLLKTCCNLRDIQIGTLRKKISA